mgnify:FL=1
MKTHEWHPRTILRIALAALLATAGCGVLPDGANSGPASEAIDKGFRGLPRVRYGSYATANFGTSFLGLEMGPHNYYWPLFEKNGIAYTCRGGHIDMIHLRITADWTAYLIAESYRHLMNSDPGFSYKLKVDRSPNYVHIVYPPAWDCLSEEDRTAIAREVAFSLGPYLAFTSVTWHEILTWYGYKCTGLPVEFASAFSWEDSYSNLLGARVALRALRDTERPYNEAVTLATREELKALGIQPAHVAREASESVRGEWYTGGLALFVDMKKRNFDIGLENGLVTPTLVPDVPGCPDAEPLPLPIPTLEVAREYGFSIRREIEPHEWEKDKILRIVHDDEEATRIDPELHFARIMHRIREEATARYGPEYRPKTEEEASEYAYRGK